MWGEGFGGGGGGGVWDDAVRCWVIRFCGREIVKNGAGFRLFEEKDDQD